MAHQRLILEPTMSLRPETRTEVPSSTAAVARAAFPRGNPYLRLRDALGSVFSDAQFAPLFPSRGQSAETPWRLALVTVLQFAENLSDRRAAEAVRGRIDWKYLLGLELADPGFDASVLSEFRTPAWCTDRLAGAEERSGVGERPLSCPWMPIVPFKLNQDRRHHIPRQRRTVTNWPGYDASLRQRGSLTVWFTEEAVEAWAAEPRTTRGGQPWYSPLAILTALTLRAVFRLAFRQTEGLIGSIIGLLGLESMQNRGVIRLLLAVPGES